MRIGFVRKPLKPLLRWAQFILFAGAICMLGYCVFVAGDAWIFQHWERHRLELLLNDPQQANGQQVHSAVSGALGDSVMPATGGLVGSIAIPSLGLSAVVIEGTTAAILRHAVGHIPGTTLPGNPGNVGISGHRDTFFRPLRKIRPNDIITLTTVFGEYHYRVVSTRIVSPDDIAVLSPTGNEALTLVTCYPFYFIGSAPKRFIVRAERSNPPLL